MTPTVWLGMLALVALAAWPAYLNLRAGSVRAAALPTMAPVRADYNERDALVAFWEGAVAKNHAGDMLSPRKLAEQYLQRYRERGDIDDVLRSEHAARKSLEAQPRANIAAEAQLATALLTLHRFHEAIAITKQIEGYDAHDPAILVREAGLDMEIGAYDTARLRLDEVGLNQRDDGWRVTQSRYLELTGHLGEARELLATASAYQNAVYDFPAQQRAWYFFRQGEMAFEAGDNDAAVAFERKALGVFPNFADASRRLASFECALKRWQPCLNDATASASIVPYPETLGYKVDAQTALGDTKGAAETNALIRTIEKIGNTQRVSDRLLAIYYSEHHLFAHDAYAIAKRELRARDDIFTEDTLAWAAAMDDRWGEARVASAKAMRYRTENALLFYHAGAIADHFGKHAEAKADFERALALNASFHPFYADDARARLAKL